MCAPIWVRKANGAVGMRAELAVVKLGLANFNTDAQCIPKGNDWGDWAITEVWTCFFLLLNETRRPPNGERLVFVNKQAGKSYFLIDLNASV